MTKKRVAIYTRVSTEDQAREGFSLQVQRETLHEFADRHEWEIVCSIPGKDIYEDDGYSGYSTERPAFKILQVDASRKFFDIILVYKQDRLSRKLKDLLAFLEELESWGIGIKSATEPFDTTSSAGRFLVQMLGSCAEFERNRLVERVFPGMIMGVKKGHWQGARYAPFGYRYNKPKKILEVVHEEAELVRKIYEMYLAGHSTSAIAGVFYKQGIATRSGGKFHTKLICDILRNKVYLGKLVWNRHHYDTKDKTKTGKGYRYKNNDPSQVIEVDGTHEPIIDQETFDRVKMRLQNNRKGAVVRFKNNVYHISGVLYCAKCGMKYNGAMVISNHRTGEKKPWYRCLSKNYPYIECDNPQIRAEDLHEQIWEILDIVCEQAPVGEQLEEQFRQASQEPCELYSEQIALKEKELKKNLEKQADLFELFKEDRINLEIYRAKADELRREEAVLKRDIKGLYLNIIDRERGLDERLRVQYFLQNLRDRGYEWTDLDIKEFVRIIFKKLTIKDGELIDIQLHHPWNLLYEKGLQCQKKCLSKKGKISRSVSNWLPSAVR